MSTLPKSYRCACGEEHAFPAYVYAHWSDKIDHTCDGCGRVNSILHGNVISSKIGPESKR